MISGDARKYRPLALGVVFISIASIMTGGRYLHQATSPTPSRQVRPFLVSTQSHVLEENGRLFEDAKRVRAGAMSRRYRIMLRDRVRVRWPTFPSFRKRKLVVSWKMGDMVFWWHGGSYLTMLHQSHFFTFLFTLILSIGYFVP